MDFCTVTRHLIWINKATVKWERMVPPLTSITFKLPWTVANSLKATGSFSTIISKEK